MSIINGTDYKLAFEEGQLVTLFHNRPERTLMLGCADAAGSGAMIMREVVKAANAHDELVASLDNLLGWEEHIHPRTAQLEADFDRARAALTKVQTRESDQSLRERLFQLRDKAGLSAVSICNIGVAKGADLDALAAVLGVTRGVQS